MKNYEELISNKKYNKIQNFIFFAINFVIFLLISILLINIIKFPESFVSKLNQDYGEGFANIVKDIPSLLMKIISNCCFFAAIKYLVSGVFIFISEVRMGSIENQIKVVDIIGYVFDFLTILVVMFTLGVFCYALYLTLQEHGEKLAYISLGFIAIAVIFTISSFAKMINKIKNYNN